LDQATGASRVDFAACRLGASLQGYATVMVSGGFAPKAAAHLTSTRSGCDEHVVLEHAVRGVVCAQAAM